MGTNYYSKKVLQFLHLFFLIIFCLTTPAVHSQTYATRQVNEIDPLCLLCSVSDPDNPINNDNLDDYSQFNIPVNLLNGSISQMLIFPSGGNNCDSLVIGVGSGNSTLSVGLFSAITVETFNGNTSNKDAKVADASILRLLDNNTRAQIRLWPGKPFDRVKIRLNTSLLGLLQTFRIYFAYYTNAVKEPAYSIPENTIVCGPLAIPITNHRPGLFYNVRLQYFNAFTQGLVKDTSFTVHRSTVYTVDFPVLFTRIVHTYIQAVDSLRGCVSDTAHRSYILSVTYAPPVVANDTPHICKGDTITITGVPTDPITRVQWYDAPVGGNLLAEGNNFTVAPQTTTTYYVATKGFCESSRRKAVTVTVDTCTGRQHHYSPASTAALIAQQTGSKFATSQSNGITGGLCLLCSISDPGNPVNNDNLDDYSQFNLTAALLNPTMYQTLIFDTMSKARCDSLIIGIGSGNSLLSLNLFGGITVQTFNGSIPNNDAQIVSTSNLRLARNNNRAEIILKPSEAFDRVQIRLNTSLLGLLQSFRIYYAYRISALPRPVFTLAPGINCGYMNTVVTNHRQGLYYKVRKVSTGVGGTIDSTYVVHSNIIPIAPVLLQGIYASTVYIQAIDPLTGCTSDTSEQPFIQGAASLLPIVTTGPFTICRGDSVTLQATRTASNQTLLWYDAMTGGNLLHTGESFRVSPGITTTYYVTAKVLCESITRIPVTVTVNDCGAMMVKTSKTSPSVIEKLELMPNPTSGRVQLNGKNDWAGSLITVKDLQGKEVYRTVLQANYFQLPVYIPNNIYIIQLITNGKISYTGKLLLVK